MLDITLDVSHVEEAVAVAQPLRLGSLFVRHVDANNLAAGTDLQRGDERVHPRAAAKVDNGFARFGIGQVKIVANAGERFDCFRRDAIEISRRVAETLGHRAAHLEVEFSVRILGDAAVHRLHLGFQFLGIEARDCRHVGISLFDWLAARLERFVGRRLVRPRRRRTKAREQEPRRVVFAWRLRSLIRRIGY